MHKHRSEFININITFEVYYNRSDSLLNCTLTVSYIYISFKPFKN